MAIDLPSGEDDADAPRRSAQLEARSAQEVTLPADAHGVSDRPGRLRTAVERLRSEDAELLARLAR